LRSLGETFSVIFFLRGKNNSLKISTRRKNHLELTFCNQYSDVFVFEKMFPTDLLIGFKYICSNLYIF
jgi:hypothetical protein